MWRGELMCGVVLCGIMRYVWCGAVRVVWCDATRRDATRSYVVVWRSGVLCGAMRCVV